MKSVNIVIPMAGLGSRFSDFEKPKPLIEVGGKTLIEHSVETLGIDGRYIFITRKYKNKKHNEELSLILNKIKPGSIEICLDHDQRGAADACMYAKEYIDNDSPLVITNCDQILKWDPNVFMDALWDKDGAVLLFNSSDPRNSFAKIDDGIITEIAEKVVISEDALVGVHLWKHGKDFVRSASDLVNNYVSLGLKECYVSTTYNSLIKEGFEIAPVKIATNGYIPIGTPKDLDIYNAKQKEFYAEKNKTIFCDIDGTILKHAHRFSHIGKEDPIDLPGVIKKFNEWDSKGHKIILTTARKESARYITEKHLSDLGFCWDYLLMGITSGQRILINDKLTEQDEDRAKSINIITDEGFDYIDWEEYGL